MTDISIHALLAESDSPIDVLAVSALPISIHALLAESDFANFDGFYWWVISIHALLAESDGGFVVGSWPRGIFLSTLSLRRATGRHRGNDRCPVHFYPRSPCGERL